MVIQEWNLLKIKQPLYKIQEYYNSLPFKFLEFSLKVVHFSIIQINVLLWLENLL